MAVAHIGIMVRSVLFSKTVLRAWRLKMSPARVGGERFLATPQLFWVGGVRVSCLGGELRAVRHRVRRTPGVRRLSAVLFVAPDLNVVLKPLICTAQVQKRFSTTVLEGGIDVGWFKEVMGKMSRWREGNEILGNGETLTQDEEIRWWCFLSREVDDRPLTVLVAACSQPSALRSFEMI